MASESSKFGIDGLPTRRGFATMAALAPLGLAAAIPSPKNNAPLVIPASKGAGARLVTAAHPRTRLVLRGVTVWGIRDYITTAFAQQQHDNRAAICATIKRWGGNHIRLRVLADEYVHLRYMGTKGTYLRWVKDWVQAAKAAGLYTYISWWDPRDSQSGQNSRAHWATKYSFAFPMMTDVYRSLKLPGGGDDPWVFYEPFNEPNNVTAAQWLVAMQATVKHWRALGFQGVLVIDTTNFSHDFVDADMVTLERWDSTLTRSRRHNLAFAHHDYCDDYPGFRFDPALWRSVTGGASARHVILESELGNSNGPHFNATWSRQIGTFFRAAAFVRPNVAGVTGFLFGPWYDRNAMSKDPAGRVPTAWGNIVRGFLAH